VSEWAPKEKNNNVHILVPKGFQNRELLQAEQGLNHDPSDRPAEGKCMKCKGTGAIVLGISLLDPEVVEGRIINCKPSFSLVKCKCYLGAFWIKFNHLNVQARIVPHWAKEIREMLEREKARIIRESGGNYNPHQDSFLNDCNYKAPKNNQMLSLEEILRQSLAKKGDFII